MVILGRGLQDKGFTQYGLLQLQLFINLTFKKKNNKTLIWWSGEHQHNLLYLLG